MMIFLKKLNKRANEELNKRANEDYDTSNLSHKVAKTTFLNLYKHHGANSTYTMIINNDMINFQVAK